MDGALFNISPGWKVKLLPRSCIRLRLPGRLSREKQTLLVCAASLPSERRHAVVMGCKLRWPTESRDGEKVC